MSVPTLEDLPKMPVVVNDEGPCSHASLTVTPSMWMLPSTLCTSPGVVRPFSIAAAGIFGFFAVFWTLPTTFLSGAAAAGGIAVINSIGNLSGFLGPYAVGFIKDRTGSYEGGLMLLAGLGVLAMIIVLLLRHDRGLERAPTAAE